MSGRGGGHHHHGGGGRGGDGWGRSRSWNDDSQRHNRHHPQNNHYRPPHHNHDNRNYATANNASHHNNSSSYHGNQSRNNDNNGNYNQPRNHAQQQPPRKSNHTSSGHSGDKRSADGQPKHDHIENVPEDPRDLTPEQQKLRQKYKECLFNPDGEISSIPLEVFVERAGWAERKREAARFALQAAAERRRQEEANNAGYSSSEDSYPGKMMPRKTGLLDYEKKFIFGLTTCFPLTTNFDIIGGDTKALCQCPLSRSMVNWRTKAFGEDFLDRDQKCRNGFDSNALIMHLKNEGGTSILHYATLEYLKYLYKDYYGEGIDHYSLYQQGETPYRKAKQEEMKEMKRAIRRGKQELQKEQAKINQLEAEKKQQTEELDELKKISEDLHEKVKMHEELRKKLGVTKKENNVLSDMELRKYRKIISTNFSLAKAGRTLKHVNITVTESKNIDIGFDLQDFLDNLYETSKKSGGDARLALFGDAEDPKIDTLVLSSWKVEFKKNVTYNASSKKAAREQKKRDTAVDEGGPYKQFLSDVFKQFDSLSVPAGSGKNKVKVKLFDKEGTSVVPLLLTDDVLEQNIKAAIGQNTGEAEYLKIQATDYMKALGRIMLNAFANRQTLPSNALPELFGNLVLRGVIPGNKDYHRDQVLKDLGCIGISRKLVKRLEDSMSTEEVFSDIIPDFFIRSRQTLLGGLMDGLSLGEPNTKFEDGSSLANMFSIVPMEALRKILFAKPNITLEDLIEVGDDGKSKWRHWPIEPQYCEAEDNDPVSARLDVAEYKRNQESFFNNQFKDYIEDRANKDGHFLQNFVQFCTAMNYIPYYDADAADVDANGKDGDDGDNNRKFKIIVEFNFTEPEVGNHPLAHTCISTMRLPGTIDSIPMKDEQYKKFCEKMDEAIATCNHFGMQ